MVNKPLIRPYFLGGVALGGVARIPMTLPWFEVADLSPKNIFGNVRRHRWFLQGDLNIGVSTRVFGGLDFSGQIYNPDYRWGSENLISAVLVVMWFFWEKFPL